MNKTRAAETPPAVEVKFANFDDVPQWMSLIDIVEDHFPGLDKDDYQKSLLECIQRKEALCAKIQGKVVGALLFSIAGSTLAFLAVHPEFRRCGIAVEMVEAMIGIFPKDSNIWVTTFRKDDKKGDAARALYLRCGFMAGELVVEMDYPCQRFVFCRSGLGFGIDRQAFGNGVYQPSCAEN